MNRLRAPHCAVLGYLEWCLAHGLPWPKLAVVAADVAQNKKEIERAFAELQDWGLIATRYAGDGLRLAVRHQDGRETLSTISTVSTSAARGARVVNSLNTSTKVAA
jgi:hypothetical protein